MSSVSISSIKKKRITKDRIYLLCLAMPFIIFVFAFSYVPIFGWLAAFFEYRPGASLDRIPFVGLQYFRWMFTTEFPELIRVTINTFALSGLSLLMTPVPLLLAVLLNEVRSNKYKRFVQTVTTLPHFVSWVIVFSLAFSMFASEGFINMILMRFGIIETHISVLDNRDAVWGFQTFLAVWKSMGWNAIIYMAAIAGIDSELYEAASIDGAGRFAKARFITIPGLLPTYFVLLMIGIGFLVSSDLTQILMFHNGLVAPRIETIDYYAFRVGVVAASYSFATAIGIVRTFVSVTLLFTANFLSKKLRGEAVF